MPNKEGAGYATWRSANTLLQHILSDDDIKEIIHLNIQTSERFEIKFIREESVQLENGSVYIAHQARKQVELHGYSLEQVPSLLAQVCKTLYNLYVTSFVTRWLEWKLRAHTYEHRLTWLGDGYGPSILHSRTLIASQANNHSNGYTEWKIVNVEDRLQINTSTSDDHSLRDMELPISIGHRNYRHLKMAPEAWTTPTQDFMIRFGRKAKVLATTFKPTEDWPTNAMSEVYKYIGADRITIELRNLHISHCDKTSTGLARPPPRSALQNPQVTFVPKIRHIHRKAMKFNSFVNKSELVKHCKHWPINNVGRANRPQDVSIMHTVLGRLDISESDVKSAVLWSGNCTRRMPLKVYSCEDDDTIREYLCVETEALLQVEISTPGGSIVLRGDVRYDFQLKNSINRRFIFGNRTHDVFSEVVVAQEWLTRALGATSSLTVATPISLVCHVVWNDMEYLPSVPKYPHFHSTQLWPSLTRAAQTERFAKQAVRVRTGIGKGVRKTSLCS